MLLNNKYNIQGPRTETNYPSIRHTVSQDRDEIHFCTDLLTGLYIVGIFHTVQQPDKKMSIFQKKKHQHFIVILSTIFHNCMVMKLLRKCVILLSNIFLTYFLLHTNIYLPCFDYSSVV